MPLLLEQLEDKGNLNAGTTALAVLTQLVEKSDGTSSLIKSALSEDSIQRTVEFTFSLASDEDATTTRVRNQEREDSKNLNDE